MAKRDRDADHTAPRRPMGGAIVRTIVLALLIAAAGYGAYRVMGAPEPVAGPEAGDTAALAPFSAPALPGETMPEAPAEPAQPAETPLLPPV